MSQVTQKVNTYGGILRLQRTSIQLTCVVNNMKIFIACPIGDANSPQRSRSDKLLKFIIEPVVKELTSQEPELVRSDKIGEPGRITTQILREITEADVVIADLSDTNPNVMYEVGIRQALLKPLVLMAEVGQRLPFDLNDLRTIFYQLELEHVEIAKQELKAHLEKAISGSISPLDRALFAPPHSDLNTGVQSSPQSDLLSVLEACQTILAETRESKDLIVTVGQLVLELREVKSEEEKVRQERAQQEMSMFLMSQFFQNPEGAEKLIPALQKLVEMGNSYNNNS